MFIEAIDELTLAVEDSHRADRRVRAAKEAANGAMKAASANSVWHRGYVVRTTHYDCIEIIRTPAASEVPDPAPEKSDA